MPTTVTFVGSADMVPELDQETACFLINRRFLVDCGWCAPLEIRRYGVSPLDLDALFLTHCHHDHVMGLPALLFYRGMWQPDGVSRPPLRIFGPAVEMPEAIENARRFLRADRFPEEWAEPAPDPLSPGDERAGDGFRFRVEKTLHDVPGLAYRFVDTATGSVVVFTGDTGYRSDLAVLAHDADLLIHDATLPPEIPIPPGAGHSSPTLAASVARDAGVRQLALIHYRRPDGPAWLEAARRIFPDTVLAREGMTLTIQQRQTKGSSASESTAVSTLFRDRPKKWGLRGDPHLWDEMAERLEGIACPPTREELASILAAEFEALVGAPITHPKPVFVKRYDHGGMSGGVVDPQFWRETALPLLESRHPDLEPGSDPQP